MDHRDGRQPGRADGEAREGLSRPLCGRYGYGDGRFGPGEGEWPAPGLGRLLGPRWAARSSAAARAAPGTGRPGGAASAAAVGSSRSLGAAPVASPPAGAAPRILRAVDLRAWFLEQLAAEGCPPLRLHAGVAADGSPEWARAFAAWLARAPGDLERHLEAVPCPHPGTLGRPDDCALCGGAGSVEATVSRWRWPLWRALRALGRSRRGREHLRVLAAIAAGRDVPEAAATAALRSVRARWRR